MKRDRALCERVLRRLTLLSTGRWPYVLCKPLKSKHGQISLYETKIDAASRIIWEVASRSHPDVPTWMRILPNSKLYALIKLLVNIVCRSTLRSPVPDQSDPRVGCSFGSVSVEYVTEASRRVHPRRSSAQLNVLPRPAITCLERSIRRSSA